jgi:hypothetical protein
MQVASTDSTVQEYAESSPTDPTKQRKISLNHVSFLMRKK